MKNFEKITETPEALGAFLAALPIAGGPWDAEFHRRFCDTCPAQNCDGANCPHNAERNNPLWWLNLEAETGKQGLGSLEGLREVHIKATQEQAAELWRMIQEQCTGEEEIYRKAHRREALEEWIERDGPEKCHAEIDRMCRERGY